MSTTNNVLYEEFLNHAPKLVCDFEKAATDKNGKLVTLQAKLNRTLFHQIGATKLADSFDAYTSNPKLRNKAWMDVVRDAKTMIGKIIENIESTPLKDPNVSTSGLSLDLSQLTQLKDSSSNLVQEMVDVYEEQNTSYLQSLQHAIERENLKKVRQIAHTMKSSFVIIGCRKLKNTAIEIEVITESAAPNLSNLKKVFAAFKNDVNQSIVMLKQQSKTL